MPLKSRKPKKQYRSKKVLANKRRTKKAQIPKRMSVVVVGKIYADWCGHCKALEPEWKLLKHKIEGHRDPATKYVVYAIEQKNQQQGIDEVNHTYLRNSNDKLALNGGYPTLFMIRNGILSYYDGNRTHLDMMKWYTGQHEKIPSLV